MFGIFVNYIVPLVTKVCKAPVIDVHGRLRSRLTGARGETGLQIDG